MDGLDKDGYSYFGYDRNGYDRDGCGGDGYDKDGYDRDGYDRGGYNRYGKARVESPEDSEQSNTYEEKYKELIKSKLENRGYSVEATEAPDALGFDLTAWESLNGYKIAIQCKNHSKPVGDKAVQEVYMGMGYCGCDIGAVVTNNTFTKSASKLAQKNNIILCEYSRIDELELAIASQIKILNESSEAYLGMEDDVPGVFEDFRPFN